jgi:AbrB family transcriptional regulator (stage V sporulation protein T)
MDTRKSVLINDTAQHEYYRESDEENLSKFYAEVIDPIIAEGDPIGAVLMGTRTKDVKMTDLELKLVETAAGFLAKQMEQ